jgi:endonuclease/exonuclease/phosphatase family metal-dependent hydrolase
LLLQEVDLGSKRSSYVDQLNYIMERTSLGYAVSGAQWKTQFIPSDGLGRLYEVNTILARWKIDGARRIALPLRTDQDALTRYFYERACMVAGRVEVPHTNGIYIINIHASAFATDDTKYKHILKLKMEMDNLTTFRELVIAGGDLNTIPTGSDSLDFCIQDMCPGESFHHPGDKPMHKDGSNYAPEQTWLDPLYNTFNSAIPLSDYLADQEKYFSHTTRPTHFWDRTLDYLFTNGTWQFKSGIVHQEADRESDHAPVSAILNLPDK